MDRGSQQLALPLGIDPEPTFDAWVVGPNAEPLAAITAMARGEGEPFLFLSGAAGTGKTHLLQAACAAGAELGLKTYCLLLQTPALAPPVLDNLELYDLLALDGLESIAGQADWEEALFALFNRLRERGGRLIVAAHAAPDHLPWGLPDLASRLQWGPRYRLRPLDDAGCEQLLRQAAERRGIPLSTELVHYIMNRFPREPAALLAVLARLDALSLSEQRRPSIPMARQIAEA